LISKGGEGFVTSLERDRVPLARPIPVKEVPLVDRAEEMNVLKEALYGAVHGEGGLVLVHGEAGIGKTRLLRELGAYARSRGVQVLYGRCPALFRMDGVPPYIIWKEVIKDYLETCSVERLNRVIGYYPAEVAKLVPELSQKLRAFAPSLSIGPEQEQNRLFEAVSQFIMNISQETPLLVVLDDLQWTDPSSLLLMHYLARGMQKTSLLLCGAYRTTEVDDKHPLSQVLTELKRERLPQSIPLKRMSQEDTSEMVKQILEQEDIPQEFCRMIYEKTRGNPFFTEEVIESLKEEEVIYKEMNRWKLKEISKIEFPASVRNVVKSRINRLDEESLNVLTMASFIGNDFTFEAIRVITGIEKQTLLKLMDKLFKTGLIKERVVHGEGICSFADILVRDVIYEEVSPLTRKELHTVVGDALEKVYAKTINEHLGELASHFLESGDREKALDYFLKAGEKAQKIYANSEAVSYYQSALRLLEEKEGECQEKARVLETLGDIKRIVGEYDACLKRWNEALLLWKQLVEKEKVARLHRKMAMTLWREAGKPKEAQENFEEALRILEAEPESVELAALYAARAHMSNLTEDVAKARSWAEKALELGKKLNALEVVASSYVDLGLVSSGIGEKKEAVQFLEKAAEIALDKGYMEVGGRALNSLAQELPAEENERALECVEQGFEWAKKAGYMRGISWFGGQLATRYFYMGNMEKALPLAQEADTLNMKIGNLFNLANTRLILGAFYHILGEWNKGEQYLEEAIRISERINNTNVMVNAYGLLGWCYWDRGEYNRAKECFEKESELLEKRREKAYQIAEYRLIAINCIELGEIDKARTLLDEMRKFAQDKQDKQLIADEDAARAMLLRAEKKWDESIILFEKSLQEYEALRARQSNVYNLAKNILYEYARTYLERNQTGDREKADNLLNQALEIYRKINAKKEIERVEAKITFIKTGKESLKPEPPAYISTGYADLDKLLYGGLPPNCAVVLTSPSCNERDILIKSFLETGAEKGEVTFYITIDASAAKALADESTPNLQLFVCNPEAEAIIKSSPAVHALKGVENLTDISIALTSAIRTMDSSLKGPRRICVGLVSDVLLYHHAVETRRWLTALITKLKSEGFTTLAVIDPRMHRPEELYATMGLFDGEISIFEKEGEKGGGKYLKINKMSNKKYLEDELPLKKE
jgi:predicted ATPase/KaiC/GvpD/RAD55 family RecA-like ATPase